MLPCDCGIDAEILQNTRGNPIAFSKQTEQNMLSADVGMVECLGFLRRKRQRLLHTRRIGNVSDELLLRTCADLFLDLPPHSFKVKPHPLKDIYRYTLAEGDQTKKQMFGADEVMMKAIGLFSRE